jgi:dTDP-4-amino-4,6-dideoxygalactose transaminase
VSRAPIARLVDLGALHAEIRPQLDAAIARVLASGRYVLGPEVEAFESAFAAACGTRFAVGCASGTDALALALLAVGVGPGDQVVCPAFGFVSTASAVTWLGATPVFADVDPATCNLSPAEARRAAAGCDRLRAILPADLFGCAADLEALGALAREHSVPLVEDAAQSVGARDASGRPVGAAAEVACFSFYPTKNLGALGDGGALVTSDPGLAQRAASLRVHGASGDDLYDRLGWTSRLDALQAAVLGAKLEFLEGWTTRRERNAARYDARLREAGAVEAGVPLAAGDLPLAIPARPAPPARRVVHHYVIRVPAAERDRLRARLRERGIESQVYYPLPLPRQKCFAHLPAAPEGFPESEAAARETLALPVHPTLAPEALETAADCIIEFLRS